MIDLERWFDRAFSWTYERRPSLAWFLLPVFMLVLASAVVWPGLLYELVKPEDKYWLAAISTLILFVVLIAIASIALLPVHTERKPTVHVFLPANDLETIGDALLQYAGFLVAEEMYEGELEVEWHDSSKKNWLDELEDCIRSTLPVHPVWVIVTMSRKGNAARERLELLLEGSDRLQKQLTVLFTVASSRFETSDRNNFFRLFVSGVDEAIAIASNIRLAHTTSDGACTKILCARNESNYGEDAAVVLTARLSNDYQVDTCLIGDLSSLNTSDYSIAIVVAYDEDLPKFFKQLKDDGFDGLAIGTTPLSVPDWQSRIDWPEEVQVLHTALDHDDEDFEHRLARINVDTIAALTNKCLIDQNTLQQLHNDAGRYAAYRKINYNYISAFCADCIGLFALAARKRKPSIRALLDDPKCDEERCRTIIKDVDFGVTGDARVNVFLKSLDRGGTRASESKAAVSDVEPEQPPPDIQILAKQDETAAHPET